MRPVSLNLKVLVRGLVNDNAWPGVPTPIDFNDAACPSESGDEAASFFKVVQGFVVRGSDASDSDDGSPSNPGDVWEYFDQDEAVALIPGWALAGWDWHAATRIVCSNDPGNFWIVSNSFYDVFNAFAICCGTPEFISQAFVFKQSNAALTPGVEYGCGTQAEFKWLALKGTNEVRSLDYKFSMKLTSQDGLTVLAGDLSVASPLINTFQQRGAWPADFIGLVVGTKEIVGNHVEPTSEQVKIETFDYGTIELTARVYDNSSDTPVVISTAVLEVSLPSTQCIPFCPDPFPDPLELTDAVALLPYNATIQIQGDAPYAIRVDFKPAWMTIALDPETGLISFTGTPPNFGNTHVDIAAVNCGNPVGSQESTTINLHIKQVINLITRTAVSPNKNYKALIENGAKLTAVGDLGGFGGAAYSADGLAFNAGTWENVPGINITGLAQNGGGLWIACGTLSGAGKVWRSSNGQDFTVQGALPAGFNSPVSICIGPGVWVILDNLGPSGQRVASSINGTAWTLRTTPNGSWTKVIWTGSNFVAVGDSVCMTSPDGTTWTARTVPAQQWRGACFDYDAGVVYAIADSGAQRLMRSDDEGATWELVTVPLGAWIAIAYGFGTLIAVGQDGQGIAFEPGDEWRAIKIDAETWKDVIAFKDYFVAVGDNGKFASGLPYLH